MSHVNAVVINDDWRITPHQYLNLCEAVGEYPTQDGFYQWVSTYLASHYSIDINKCNVQVTF